MMTAAETNTATPPRMDYKAQVKLAAAQIAPVFMDKAATTAKVCDMIREAGRHGAHVIGFPECCIPGYPGWGQALPADGPVALALYKQQFHASVEVPGPETDLLGQACRDAGVWAVVGINERLPGATGTLFNTQVIIDPRGALGNKHQKYVPTVTERLVHGPGRTGTATSARGGAFGTLSGLICGENCNPLALHSVSLDYPTVHVASWPAHFGRGCSTQDDILAITRAIGYNLGCFVINSVSINDDLTIDAYVGQDAEARAWMLRQREREGEGARATIIGPSGKLVAGPLAAGEGILYAEVNIEDVLVNKFSIDVAGHYNRPELFAHHFQEYF